VRMQAPELEGHGRRFASRDDSGQFTNLRSPFGQRSGLRHVSPPGRIEGK